jgi:hypothetical protein
MRKLTRRISLATAGALVASLAVLAPASADHSPTHVTGKPAAATLSISQPVAFSLGVAPTGSRPLSGAFGEVTVTDNRGGNFDGYTVQAQATAFTTTTATGATYSIPAVNLTYTTPAVINGSGTAVRLPGPGGTLDQPRIVMTATQVKGKNTSVWNPTITVALPSDAVAGTYTGTITHSVA